MAPVTKKTAAKENQRRSQTEILERLQKQAQGTSMCWPTDLPRRLHLLGKRSEGIDLSPSPPSAA